MSAELIKKEGYNASIRMTIDEKEFDKYCDNAYNKQKNKIVVQGFRKGKVPRNVIEKMYGEGFFYEDALNEAFNEYLPKALEELDLDIVSQPKVDVEKLKKGEDVILTAELIIKPDFEIGEYKNLKIEREKIEISNEDVEKNLQDKREKNARFIGVEDRPVKEMDTIKLDFLGKVDGVAFEGGKAEDYTLVVGSNSFIEGFEPQLLGMNLGDEKTIEVKFPENYHSDELAGKDATFDVKINEIKEKQLPDLDDDFAMDISEFDTLEELKSDIKSKLEEQKEKEVKVKLENDIIDNIIENSKFDLPEEMIDTQINHMIEDFTRSLSYQGMSMDMYLQFTGNTIDKVREDLRPEAEKRVKSTMVLDKVKELENIGYSENQIDEEIEKMAKSYSMDLDKLKERITEEDRKYLKDNVIVKNTLNFLVSENEKK